ncbi:MAG: hypothetical protein ACFFE8_08585 [Candidatus Heimdallarchaeota archaeon]
MPPANIVRPPGPGFDSILLTADHQNYSLVFVVAILLFCGALISPVLLKETKNESHKIRLMQDSGSAMDSQ